ncbi:hypothetical protein SLA2020_522950 [Shorea laevis]
MWEGQEFGFKGACSENQMGKERRLRQWKQSLSVGVRQNPNVDFSQQPQRFQKSRAFPYNCNNVELRSTKVLNLAKGSRTSTNFVNSVFELRFLPLVGFMPIFGELKAQSQHKSTIF